MHRFKRSARVSDLLHSTIAEIVEEDLKDPRIGFVTITEVSVSDDLKNAKVYFSCLGSEEDKIRSEERLNASAGYIKKLIGERTSLKYLPTIKFIFDRSIEKSLHIHELLNGVKDEKT